MRCVFKIYVCDYFTLFHFSIKLDLFSCRAIYLDISRGRFLRDIRMRIMRRKRHRKQDQKVCRVIESTMFLPCPYCDEKDVFVGLSPVNLEQTIFHVVMHCSCGRGLNGGSVFSGRLYGNRLEYVEGEKVIGVFDPNKNKWDSWAT